MDESANQPKDNDTSSPAISRSAKILQAASPYLDSDSKHMLESIVRVTDFMETIQMVRQQGFPSIFGRRTGGDTIRMANLSQAQPVIDSEALLRSIRPFCSSQEGAMIDKIMSFFNIQRIFSMYQMVSNMMSTMNPDGNQETGDNTGFNPFMNNMSGDMSQAMAMASMMSQMMNSNSSANTNSNTEESSDYSPPNDENTSTENDHDSTTQDYNEDTYWNNQNINYRHSYAQSQESTNSEQQNDSYDDYNSSSTQSNNTDSNDFTNDTSTNSSMNNNQQMIDMLSTMIPPEQKGTFDAMKLLIESGMLK